MQKPVRLEQQLGSKTICLRAIMSTPDGNNCIVACAGALETGDFLLEMSAANEVSFKSSTASNWQIYQCRSAIIADKNNYNGARCCGHCTPFDQHGPRDFDLVIKKFQLSSRCRSWLRQDEILTIARRAVKILDLLPHTAIESFHQLCPVKRLI